MRRFKLLGLALVAVFAATAALSASAFAVTLPENLPEATNRAFTGTSVGITKLHAQGQEPIECTEAPGEGIEETSKPVKSSFHINFTNCTSKAGGVTVKCTGLGDATGVILALGTSILVFDEKIGAAFANLTTAVLFKNNAVHFTCGGLVLVEVLAGETLCLHKNATVKSTTHEFECSGEIAGGVPKPTDAWCKGGDVNNECRELTTPVLLASINHATAVPALQLGVGTVKTVAEIFADQ